MEDFASLRTILPEDVVSTASESSKRLSVSVKAVMVEEQGAMNWNSRS